MATFEASGAFDAREKLVLRLAVAMTRTPASIDDTLFAELAREFSEAQLAELAMAVAWENGRARFNRVWAIGSEHFCKGDYCPLPET
jgi:alkylhydroperoxidase family enzyme